MEESTREYILIALLLISNIFGLRALYLNYKNRKK